MVSPPMTPPTILLAVAVVVVCAPMWGTLAFQVTAPPPSTSSWMSRSSTTMTTMTTMTPPPMTRLFSSTEQEVNTDAWEEDSDPRSNVERFLDKKFPAFYQLLGKNDEVWKTLNTDSTSSTGYTLFAPNAQAFQNLGEKKRNQLEDPRNLEIAQKIGLYHVVPTEAVTNQRLRTEDWTVPKPKDGGPRPITVSGIQTLAGEVPVGRSKSGGFLGFGAKEDGDAVVGPNARILQSYVIGENIIHEMDSLVSPELLWRYCDQLRIL